jgi:2-phosphoglycerate kinase
MTTNRRPGTEPRVILIGGTSHTGKTTIALALANTLHWSYASTDKMARHPGRPWNENPDSIPEQVVEHYLGLSTTELLDNVLDHYGHTVWPLAESLISTHSTDHSAGCLVIEGSALWPEYVARISHENVAAIWLTASNEFLENRIVKSSGYTGKSEHEKNLISRFIQRSLIYNEKMLQAISKLDLLKLDVESLNPADHSQEIILRLLSTQSASNQSAFNQSKVP